MDHKHACAGELHEASLSGASLPPDLELSHVTKSPSRPQEFLIPRGMVSQLTVSGIWPQGPPATPHRLPSGPLLSTGCPHGKWGVWRSRASAEHHRNSGPLQPWTEPAMVDIPSASPSSPLAPSHASITLSPGPSPWLRFWARQHLPTSAATQVPSDYNSGPGAPLAFHLPNTRPHSVVPWFSGSHVTCISVRACARVCAHPKVPPQLFTDFVLRTRGETGGLARGGGSSGCEPWEKGSSLTLASSALPWLWPNVTSAEHEGRGGEGVEAREWQVGRKAESSKRLTRWPQRPGVWRMSVVSSDHIINHFYT